MYIRHYANVTLFSIDLNILSREVTYNKNSDSNNNNNNGKEEIEEEPKYDLDEVVVTSSVDLLKSTEELNFLFCPDFQDPARYWRDNESRLDTHWKDDRDFCTWASQHVAGTTVLGRWVMNIKLLEPLIQDIEFAHSELLLEDYEEETKDDSEEEDIPSEYEKVDAEHAMWKILKTED